MATLHDTERDSEKGAETRSAAPGTQGEANTGARGHDEEEVASRTSWTSAAPGAQGEANTWARLHRRW